MNATASNRLWYLAWRRKLTTVYEYPVARGNRGSAANVARRRAAANSVRKYENEMEYE